MGGSDFKKYAVELKYFLNNKCLTDFGLYKCGRETRRVKLQAGAGNPPRRSIPLI
jgi:hypothetical protein